MFFNKRRRKMIVPAVLAVVIVVVVIAVSMGKRRSKNALRDKYLNLPLTRKLAHEAGQYALEGINKANRAVYEENVLCCVSVLSYAERCGKNKGKYGSIRGAASYIFRQHNLRSLSRNEIKAFLWAVSTLTRLYVLDNLDKDPSGPCYKLSAVKKRYICNHGVKCSFTYTAPNGYYQAPKDW